jgi:hypothetical protein
VNDRRRSTLVEQQQRGRPKEPNAKQIAGLKHQIVLTLAGNLSALDDNRQQRRYFESIELCPVSGTSIALST